MKKLKCILLSNHFLIFLSIVFLLSDLLYTTNYPHHSKYSEDDTTFIGTVEKYQVEDSKLVIDLKAKERLIVNYPLEEKNSVNLSYGDQILVKGTLVKPSSLNIPHTFNYAAYLQNKKIYYLVDATTISKIENNHKLYYTVKNILLKHITNLKSQDYLRIFLLGENNLPSSITQIFQSIGISHLFSVSGMHITLIMLMVNFYLDKITYRRQIKKVVSIIILLFYYLLIRTPSLLRSSIMHILFNVNDLFKLKIDKLGILMLTLIISLIINPFIIYDLGFIYSYLISFFLIMYVNKTTNKITKVFEVSILSFLVSLPITISTSYEINLISILSNIILSSFAFLIIYPLIVATIVIPAFDNILFFFINIFTSISSFLSSVEVTKLIFPKPSIIVIIIYYLLLIIVLRSRNYLPLFIGLILSLYHIESLNPIFEVTVFDVGQADSLLIKFPYSRENILIDTGSNAYTLAQGIIPYLKSRGIRKIDYLIITHGDFDHIGASNTLIENFKVDKVIFNSGPYSKEEKSLIETLQKKNIKYYRDIRALNLSTYQLQFLNTKIYDNENDNSSVIYLNYHNFQFLFMGDAESPKERDILAKYNLKDITFLKVGHHGSDTSSSRDFIGAISPEYSLISVGKDNIYHHPKDSVLDILSNSKIYRTDLDGSITIFIDKQDYKIKTYRQN